MVFHCVDPGTAGQTLDPLSQAALLALRHYLYQMASGLLQSFLRVAARLPSAKPAKIFSVPQRGYREIKVTEGENESTIEGVIHEEDDSTYLSPDNPEDTCPLRSRGIQITYEDVLILRQFIHSDGEILPREITGLCNREHMKVTAAVKMAQRANLLPGSESQIDERGNEVPKLNRYLTRFPVGSQNPVKRRGPYWKKRHYKVGDARAIEDAPHVSNRRVRDSH